MADPSRCQSSPGALAYHTTIRGPVFLHMERSPVMRCCLALLATLLPLSISSAAPAPRKIVLIAGEKDKGHPKGTHEYELSVRLLEHCLKTAPDLKGIRVESHFKGW